MSKYSTTKEYLFVQDDPANVWTVKHSCSYPSLDVYIYENSQAVKMIPSKVEYLNASTARISFSGPFSGFVKISG